MPISDVFRLGPDGKVIPGVTYLRDPQTGETYQVVSVCSGRMPTKDGPAWNNGGDEKSALNGGARAHYPGGAS